MAQKAVEPVDMYLPLPVESRAIGEHGVVELEGGVGADGRVADLKVVRSSRSERLDQLALTRLGRARISQDIIARGEVTLRLNARFYAWDVNEAGKTYPCSQAVLDYDWYARAFPESPHERSPLRALVWFAVLTEGKGSSFHLDDAKLDQAWTAAIAVCRNDGNALFMSAFAEQGRRLVRAK